MNKLKSEDWKKIIEDWRQSGKSQRGFCQEKKINVSTFYYWKKRIFPTCP